MTERIEKTVDFVRRKLAENPYFETDPAAGAYRLEHTFRVARIGQEIAEKEGLPVENMVLACLLHDVSYCRAFSGYEEWLNHGRASARIARPFLKELGLEAAEIEEICCGIAIHVDGRAEIPGERSLFAQTVGDADNIDRFDAYRLYETLENAKFSAMPLLEKTAYADGVLAKLEGYLQMPLATSAATALWQNRIAFYQDFYQRLRRQLRASTLEDVRPSGPAGETAQTTDSRLGLAGDFVCRK